MTNMFKKTLIAGAIASVCATAVAVDVTFDSSEDAKRSRVLS